MYLNLSVLYRGFKKKNFYKELEFIKLEIKKDYDNLHVLKKIIIFSLLAVSVAVTYYHKLVSIILLTILFLFVINVLPRFKQIKIETLEDSLIIRRKYQEKHRFIFNLSRFVKIFLFLYVAHFFVWCFLSKFYFLALNGVDYLDLKYTKELEDSAKKLYVLYYLFMNFVILDNLIESFIWYSTFDSQILMTRLFLSTATRTLRALSFTVIGSGAVGSAFVYSPIVEMPGVNYFQVNYGRGYGYKTIADYWSGVIYQRYLTDDQMVECVNRYASDDKILNGIFFKCLRDDIKVKDIMLKNASINELRALGLRKY